jgi:hypothetical protein
LSFNNFLLLINKKEEEEKSGVFNIYKVVCIFYEILHVFSLLSLSSLKNISSKEKRCKNLKRQYVFHFCWLWLLVLSLKEANFCKSQHVIQQKIF